MADLKAVVYVSSSNGTLGPDALEDLLQDARSRNERVGVTGFLLHCEGNFMQYIEGPPQAIDSIYARIQADRRHHSLVAVYEGPMESRQFDGWAMAYAPTHTVDFVRLSKARWSELNGAPVTTGPVNAIRMLGDFWAQHRQGSPKRLFG